MAEDERRFVPLSVREGGGTEDWDVLHEGVPAHLVPSLRGAVAVLLGTLPDLAATVQRRLRLTLPPRPPKVSNNAMLLGFADSEPARYLDIADCLLDSTRARFLDSRERGGSAWGEPDEDAAVTYVRSLRRALDEADSAYAVDLNEDGPWRLVRRVNPTATDALHDAVQRGDDSSSLLATAWAATFQRDPNLGLAYRDAVLAVESAACPILIPNNKAPTLGQAIAHLRDTVDKWTVANLDAQSQSSGATLLAMLQTVWQNQGRHVGQGGRAPEPVRQDEAEAVLFLAITLVQWFERGLVAKRP